MGGIFRKQVKQKILGMSDESIQIITVVATRHLHAVETKKNQHLFCMALAVFYMV